MIHKMIYVSYLFSSENRGALCDLGGMIEEGDAHRPRIDWTKAPLYKPGFVRYACFNDKALAQLILMGAGVTEVFKVTEKII